MKNTESKNNTDLQKEKRKEFNAWLLAGELGYTIVVPVVIFAVLGRLADKYFYTSPFLFVVGVILSIFLSSWIIYRKVIDIIKM